MAGRRGESPPFGSCLPLDLASLWISSASPTVKLSFPTPLASSSLHVFPFVFIIKRMSSHTTPPTEFLDEFRTTFHRDFPYDYTRWRDNLVLESREGIRSHFASQIFIDASAFFAGAPISTPSDDEEPIPGHGRLQPIPLAFASSPALRYLLIVLRHSSSIRNAKPLRLLDGECEAGTILGDHCRERASCRDIGCARTCEDDLETKPSRRFLQTSDFRSFGYPTDGPSRTRSTRPERCCFRCVFLPRHQHPLSTLPKSAKRAQAEGAERLDASAYSKDSSDYRPTTGLARASGSPS
jgi:hypothetical protein